MPTGVRVSVDDLLRETRRGIQVPVGLAAVFVALTCLYLWTATPLYEAKITITARPTGDETVSGSKLVDLGSLGGLAGAKRLTNYDKLIAILISNDTASDFLSHGDLMGRFFPDKWDHTGSGAWRRPTGIRASLRGFVNKTLGFPAWTSPAAEPVLSLFDDYVRITPNELGRSHTISFYAPDRQTATDALSVLLNSADRILRQRGQKASSDKLLFLRRILSDEQLVEVRTTLANEMGKEFVTNAMLTGQMSYSYDVLKSESVSSMPASPRPLLSLVIATLAGVLLGMLVIVVRARAGQEKLNEI